MYGTSGNENTSEQESNLLLQMSALMYYLKFDAIAHIMKEKLREGITATQRTDLFALTGSAIFCSRLV